MATKWYYNYVAYDTEAEANAAVANMKSRLDNNPTDWVIVKEVTTNSEGGWIVPSETLTDEQINNISEDNNYNVNSIYSGTTYTGITGANAILKIAELRTEYARRIQANTIMKHYAPTNEDMSGYV
ncbi:MAG: hypothetical protein ACPF8W_00050 [Luminiphilus sp.]